MKKIFLLNLGFFLFAPAFAGVVPLKDNVLLAFEKCKSLSVDLEKGQLKEAVAPSFDLLCRKVLAEPLQMKCDFFESGSEKMYARTVFKGGSELGIADLKDERGRKIKFLIGKGFASFESPEDKLVCIGIYLFEKEALKKKALAK